MILVTGGTGLVGSHLLLKLLQSGNKVKAIHRKNSDLQAVKKVFGYYLPNEEAEFLFGEMIWVSGSLNDIPSLSEAFKGVAKVYHCAALVSFDSRDSAALRKINIEGTANIVNLCISNNVEKMCYISSVATMDLTIGEKYITEDFTWHPEKDHSEYAISKHGAEIEVWRASQEGVPVVILNPGVILGPGFWNKGTGHIFKKIYDGFNYHFPKITGFVGVQDVAELAVRSMESGIINEQYIVVSQNLSFKEVFEEVAGSYKKQSPGKSLKPWMIYIGWLFQSISSFLFGTEKQLSKKDYKSLFEHSIYSNEKIKSEFSYDFRSIKEVIRETAEIFVKEEKAS